MPILILTAEVGSAICRRFEPALLSAAPFSLSQAMASSSAPALIWSQRARAASSVSSAMIMNSTQEVTLRPVFSLASISFCAVGAKAVGVFTPLPKQKL
ncbi:hypothetical protein ALP75_201400 [Pseudomonas syringae pv. actinidiae]|nr:hypothetical protein ALP75_201400 [Pseudomonas syringae pv. actinidiae]